MTKGLPISFPLHLKGALPQDAYLNNPSSISIYRTSDLIAFVRPPNPEGRIEGEQQEEPNDDCIITGVVIVHLTQPRKVAALRVRFVALCRLAFPNRPVEDDVLYETQVMTQNEINPEEGMLIEPGPQRFEFSLVVPSCIAPFNRTPAGAVWHKIEATLVGTRSGSIEGDMSANWLGGWLNKTGRSSSPTPTRPKRPTSPIASFFGRSSSPTSPGPMVSHPGATAPASSESAVPESDKWLNANMTASKEIWIIALPTLDKKAVPLAMSHQSFLTGLGIVPWSLSTDAITVSGYLHFKLGLYNTHLNPRSTIWGVRLFIDQQVSIKSPRRPEEEETTLPVTRMLLYEKGGVPAQLDLDSNHYSLKSLWTGHQVPNFKEGGDANDNTFEVLRLPDEEKLRPTSYIGSQTPVRVQHWFALSVFFSVWDEDVKGQPLNRHQHGQLREGKLRIKTAITHCSCTVKNLALPPYEAHSGPSAKDEGECDLCACGQRLDQLMERELDRHGDDIEAFDELGETRLAQLALGSEADARKGRERPPVVKS